MSIEQAVVDHINGDASITALTGANKIYASVMPNSKGPPAIVYQLSSGTHEGYMGGISGLANTGLDLRCYGTDYATTNAIADAVRLSVDRFHGTMGTVQTANVRSISINGPYDTYEPSSDEEHKGIHGKVMTLSIWHTESKS